ncbi:hypothetical protein [Planomonospora algeriensis]
MNREKINPYSQRLIKRSPISQIGARILLPFLLLNLTWEIVKNNLDPPLKKEWPWRLIILDLPTTATLAGIFAAAMIARAQLAKTMNMSISWSAGKVPSKNVRGSIRTVFVKNGGAGRGVVHEVRYQILTTGGQLANSGRPSESWLLWAEAVEAIEKLGIKYNKDFKLMAIGSGAALVPAGTSEGYEVFAINRKGASKVTQISMRIRVVDIIGDTYERVIICIEESRPNANKAFTSPPRKGLGLTST